MRHPVADMCILFTQDSKRDRKYPGASLDDLHVKGGRYGRGRVLPAAAEGEITDAASRWREKRLAAAQLPYYSVVG